MCSPRQIYDEIDCAPIFSPSTGESQIGDC
jgi:hypothetical protein